MSDHNQNDSSRDAGLGNFAALILIINLVVVLVILAALYVPPLPQPPTPDLTAIARRATEATPVPPTPTPPPTSTPTPRPTNTPTPAPTQVSMFDPSRRSIGERIFSSACTACHGFNGGGISGLGPSFIGNEFVNTHSNTALLEFVKVGRQVTDPANTTGVAMPARGGNPSLTDQDLAAVIVYLRSLNPDVPIVEDAPADTTSDTTDTSTTDTTTDASTTDTTVEAAATDAPEVTEPVEAAEFVPIPLTGITAPRDETADRGEDAFFTSAQFNYNFACAGCHGLQGEGVSSNGPALADSQLLQDANGAALFEMFTTAHPPANPETDGFMHPYRGGYPQLTDEQLLGLIGYLYSLPGVQR
ncbi:MAG: cytochrome c [Chloroflexi bacterium]|nr:cytochrome c [Chloroflexota bacterium]